MLCEKQVTPVSLCPTPFDIHPAFFIGIHPVFMPELVILHRLPFKACFHLQKCFLSRSPFIFCSLPPLRRAKALRIANSPFPHLTSVCHREEGQFWKFYSEFCQFHRQSDGLAVSGKNSHLFFLAGNLVVLSIKHTVICKPFLLEKDFSTVFFFKTPYLLSSLFKSKSVHLISL